MAQYAYMSEPDPEWLSATSIFQWNTATPTDLSHIRTELDEIFRRVRDRLGGISDGVTVANWENVLDDRVLAVRTYIPSINPALGESESHRFPVLVWIHGGGFVTGSLDFDDPKLSEWATEFRIVCVHIDYRKAPEHPFPAAFDDAYAGLQWTLANADIISVDINKGFIVSGGSAGGNLATAIAQKASRDPTFRGKLTGQILIMPCIIAHTVYPEQYKPELLSIDQNAYTPALTKKAMDLSWKCYAPTPDIASDPRVSPGLATSFAGLPPTYIQAAGLDPLRDEAFLYARLLREAGVPTKIDGYPGVPHGFEAHYPNLKITHQQKTDFRNAITWLLSGTSSNK